MASRLNSLRDEYPGRPIVDATSHLMLTVIEGDLKKAKGLDPRHCAFANACVRQDQNVVEAIVFRYYAYLVYKTKIVRYSVTSSMRQEIIAIDRGGAMGMGEYRLAPPIPSQRLGSSKSPKRKARTKNPKSADTPTRHQTVLVRKATFK